MPPGHGHSGSAPRPRGEGRGAGAPAELSAGGPRGVARRPGCAQAPQHDETRCKQLPGDGPRQRAQGCGAGRPRFTCTTSGFGLGPRLRYPISCSCRSLREHSVTARPEGGTRTPGATPPRTAALAVAVTLHGRREGAAGGDRGPQVRSRGPGVPQVAAGRGQGHPVEAAGAFPAAASPLRRGAEVHSLRQNTPGNKCAEREKKNKKA